MQTHKAAATPIRAFFACWCRPRPRLQEPVVPRGFNVSPMRRVMIKNKCPALHYSKGARMCHVHTGSLQFTEKSTSKASRKRKAHLQVARHGSRRADKQLTQKHYLVPSLFDYLQLLPSLWGVRSCTLQHFSETFQSLIGNRDARSHNYS